MQTRLKNGTIIFKTPPTILATSVIVGEKESQGPLGSYFKNVMTDDKFGEKTFEKAERSMLKYVINGVINKLHKTQENVGIIIGGDLLNQIISMSFCAREFDTQFLGVYGACSTMAESLIVASMMLDADYASSAVCVTGTHFSSVERQYRFPLDMGTQRPPSSQWTVTGAGAAFVTQNGEGVKITKAMIGKVIDYGVTDVNNMGAAMAPAVVSTLVRFFNDTQTLPSDYDAIVTGDLGRLGSEVLRDLMNEKSLDISQNHFDCGAMIFNNRDDAFQGGSGCGCSATVLNAYFIPEMLKGKFKKLLFIATGALLSPLSSQQSESIPSIAHLVLLENN